MNKAHRVVDKEVISSYRVGPCRRENSNGGEHKRFGRFGDG